MPYTDVMNRQKFLHFMEFIRCSQDVCLWVYNADLKLLYVDENHHGLSDILEIFYFKESASLPAYLKTCPKVPVIFHTNISLTWICSFSYEKEQLAGVYVIGPFFLCEEAGSLMQRELSRRSIPAKTGLEVFRKTNFVPVISLDVLSHYALMFHYAITGRKVAREEISHFKGGKFHPPSPKGNTEKSYQSSWLLEKEFLRLLASGNPSCRTVLANLWDTFTAPQEDSPLSPLRRQQLFAHTLLTLCSRACIDAGLSASTAYTLQEQYADSIEHCVNLAELFCVKDELVNQFLAHMDRLQEQNKRYRMIYDACHYIETHLTEHFEIGDISGRFGYSDYYFSKIFREATGKSMHEYIMEKKLEQAKLLLCDTEKSIQEISDELAFNNRNYFHKCFKKYTGLSPRQYRDRHYHR